MPAAGILAEYLEYSRHLVLDEIRAIVPVDRRDTGGLYGLMLEYPLRAGKSLRPAISIAICRALGGSLAAVLPTAAVLELYHNAFLIHDDIEDQSYLRRDESTLNRLYGVPTAINVGDGMLALSMQPLLDNIGRIGMGRTLKVLRTVARMARESAEGQMLELQWISRGAWDHVDADYVRLVHKKTGWYSFIAPALVGAVIAGTNDSEAARIAHRFIALGIAFQIQDDILNLVSAEGEYGKDLYGDLWEGKHTLILIHALRVAPVRDRGAALEILRKPHPADPFRAASAAPLLTAKTETDIAFLRDLTDRCGSIAYARDVGIRYARWFHRQIHAMLTALPRSYHRDFLADLADFTVSRAV